MGNGCTSGHSVCGIPRFSMRSIVATCTFMGTAMLLSTFRYRLHFLYGDGSNVGSESSYSKIAFVAFSICAGLACFFLIAYRAAYSIWHNILSYLVGLIFGVGLMVSGMTKVSKILGFLTLNQNWDPSLMFVMVGALAFNVVSFRIILSKGPVYNVSNSGIPSKGKVDAKLVLGAGIFGLGWGLAGLCPGPGMINLFVMWNFAIWIGGLAIG